MGMNYTDIGFFVDRDYYDRDGKLLIAKGKKITEMRRGILERLSQKDFAKLDFVK